MTSPVRSGRAALAAVARLSVLVTVAALGACVPGGNDAVRGGWPIAPASGYSLSDDFNDRTVGEPPPGWSLDAPGGTVTVSAFPDAVDRSLKLTKAAGREPVSITRRFRAVTGVVQVQARVRVEQASAEFDVIHLVSAGGVAAASVAVRHGRFTDVATGQAVLPALAHRWYWLRVVLNTGTRRYDLFVDGEKVLGGATFRDGATDIGRITTGIRGGNPGTLYLDAVTAHRIPDPSVSYVVLDQFNDASPGSPPTDYELTSTGGVSITATPSDEDRSVLLAKRAGGGESQAVRTFAPQTGTVIVQANVRTDEAAGTKVALYTQSSDGRTASAIQFNNGWLVYYTGDIGHQLTPATPGQWYTLRLVLDVAAGQFEVFVDGRKLVPPGTGAGVPSRWAFRDVGVGNIGRLVFGVGSGQSGTVRVDNVMVYRNPVAAPPGTVVDVRRPPYNAAGDGLTDDTAAIQRAIDDVPDGGSVLLSGGIFRSGTIKLKSGLTLWINHDAVLLGTRDDAGYPTFTEDNPGGRLAGGVLSRALIAAVDADRVRIEGGGTVDGNGHKPEWGIEGGVHRPALIALLRGSDTTIRNIHIANAATWAIVPAEVDGLLIADVNIDSNIYANRDGIDVVDSHGVLIERVNVWSDDDAICFKSYSAKGVDGATVRLSTVGRSERANGIKFGTASRGSFRNVVVEDVLIKHVDKAAIKVTSVDGSVVSNLAFRRITIGHALRAFFVVLGKRTEASSMPRWVSGLAFEAVVGTQLAEPTALSGQELNGTTHKLYGILLSNVRLTVAGGVRNSPREPAQYSGTYPEGNLWTGSTTPPAHGHFLRHVNGLTIRGSTTTAIGSDSRPPIAFRDVMDVNIT